MRSAKTMQLGVLIVLLGIVVNMGGIQLLALQTFGMEAQYSLGITAAIIVVVGFFIALFGYFQRG